MRSIAIRYGLLMGLSFTIFFLLMHMLHLSENYNLRILNGVIHLAFLFIAIRAFMQQFPESAENYLAGVAQGMWTSAIGVASFAVFMFAFLETNPTFLKTLQQTLPMGQYVNSFTAGAAVLMEGLVASLIGSYIIVRILDWQHAGDTA